jgi:hypothetical protein
VDRFGAGCAARSWHAVIRRPREDERPSRMIVAPLHFVAPVTQQVTRLDPPNGPMLSQRLHDRTHRPTSVTGPVTLSAVPVARPTPSRLGSPRQGRPTLTRPVRLAVLSRRDASCRLVHRRSSDRGHSRSDPRPPGESQGRKAGVARLVRGRRAVAPSSASQAPPSIAANRCFNTLASSLPRAASRQRAANPSSLPDPPPLYDIRPPSYVRQIEERARR